MWQAMASFRQDYDAMRGRKIERALLRRVFQLARPYRRHLIGFLVAVIAAAVVTAIPPLLLKSLLDTAVPQRDVTLVTVLAAGAVLLALASAGLSLLQRWYSATIGEGLIYDMRVSLFDHVQRLPLSFFPRLHARPRVAAHDPHAARAPVVRDPRPSGRSEAPGAHPRVDAAQRHDEQHRRRALQRRRRARGEAVRQP